MDKSLNLEGLNSPLLSPTQNMPVSGLLDHSMTSAEVQQLVTFGFLPDSRSVPRPAINLDKSLFEAVTLVRVALRRKDTAPGELARAATLLLGLPDAALVARLATHAEDQCAAARMALRLKGGG